MMRVVGILFLFVSSSVFSADRQLVCPYIADDTPGLLEGGAWRIDTFIFDPNDFEKDSPNLTQRISLGG